jgi:hypothetical protein
MGCGVWGVGCGLWAVGHGVWGVGFGGTPIILIPQYMMQKSEMQKSEMHRHRIKNAEERKKQIPEAYCKGVATDSLKYR